MEIIHTQRRADTGEVTLKRAIDLEELDDFLRSVFHIGATCVEVTYGGFHSLYEKKKEAASEDSQETAGITG